MPDTCRKILLIRVDRIGDLILSTPFFQNLPDAFPDAEVVLLGRGFSHEVLTGHRAIRRCVSVDGPDGGRVLRSLANERFDLVIDMHCDYILRTALLARRVPSSCRVGFDIAGRGSLFDIAVPAPHGKHFVEETFDIYRALGYEPKRYPPSLWLAPEVRKEARRLLAERDVLSPYLVLHPGGFYPAQRWPARHFARVAQYVSGSGITPVFIGGPEDGPALAEIDAMLGSRARIFSACSLGVSAAIISGAILFVGNNSGPLHIAGAAGVPSVSTMGPTDPVRFWPLSPHAVVLRAATVTDISAEDVGSAVEKSLAARAEPA
jgi:ADP-heptose:LPS heptosyltransferase